MDSIKWNLNNSSIVYTSNSFTDVITLAEPGNYTLNIICYKDDQSFIKTLPLAVKVSSINPEVNLSVNSIFASPTGMTYKWLDCEKNYALIPGETSQIFNATVNGSYAVEIFDGFCSDTSECVQITGVGITENSFDSEIKLYPNPTNKLITLELSKTYSSINYTLRNNIGQIVSLKDISNKNIVEIDLFDKSKGIYTLHITSNDKQIIFKIIKE